MLGSVLVSRLKNGQMAPVFLVAVVLLGFDVSARLFTFTDNEDYSENIEPLKLHLRPLLDSERYNLITSALSLRSNLASTSDQIAIDKVDNSANPDPIVGYEKIGEFNYRLIAVFASKQKFAVLERRDGLSPILETFKVYVGDTIGNLSVKSINSKSLELEDEPNSAVLLSLFEPEST